MKKLEKKIGISCEVRSREVNVIYAVKFESSIIETGKISVMPAMFNNELLQDFIKSIQVRFEGFEILLDHSLFDL